MGRLQFRPVETKEWFPKHEPLDYPDKFVKWIDSINTDFRYISYYREFELYKMQAEWWIKEDESERIQQYADAEDQKSYITKIKKRCAANSLYACNRFGYLKDGTSETGWVKYTATPAQEILHFLEDSGYSFLIVKGRQIGFTSAEGLMTCNDLNIRTNFFTKFITHDVEKGIEIFNDKMKDPFMKFPDWFRSSVDSNKERQLRTGFKEGKVRKGRNSRIFVATPHKYAINGGSPQKVKLDEIGMFEGKTFSQMMNENRPTMYYYDTKKEKLIMRRQVVGWGTGGDMDKGGAELETEWRAAEKAWKERKFSHGFIPLFFSCWARIGFTQEHYEKEKEYYYSKNDPEQEIQFHQTYPITPEDVFLRNSRTLIPIPTIKKMILKINSLPLDAQGEYGYFRPKFDTNISYPETMKVPHPIIGAEWVPTSGMNDPQTTAFMWRKPEPWVNRYYQGIDPINSETGHSRFSSAIWDKELNEVSNLVFYREKDYKMCYIQSLLQRLYFSPRSRSIPYLLENNIGDDCFNEFKLLGHEKGFLAQQALPPHLRTGRGGKFWGISKKSNTSGRIVEHLSELLDFYHENIMILWIYLHLQTFVEVDVNSQTHRETKFAPHNKHKDYDDDLDATTFAYICATTSRGIPRPEHDAAGSSVKKKIQFVREGGQLVPRYVDGNGRVVGRVTVKKLPGF